MRKIYSLVVFWLALVGCSLPLGPLGHFLADAFEGPPRLRLPGHDIRKVAPLGSDVILPCPVRADPTTLFLEWSKARQPLTSGGKYRFLASGSLRIRKVSEMDSGEYTCKAVNGFGSVTIIVFLTVIDQREIYESGANHSDNEGFADVPDIGGPPRLTFVTSFNGSVIQRSAGGTVRLKCEGAGKPGPKIFWLKNGIRLGSLIPTPNSDNSSTASPTAIPNKTIGKPSRIVRKRWSIQLEKLKQADSGNYTCILRNPYGAVSASFLLEVIDGTKPEVTGYHPLNTTVEFGSSATFQCRVRSEVAPHIRWLKRVDSSEMPSPKSSSSSSSSGKGQQRIIRVQGEYFRFLKSSQVVSRPDGSFMNKLLIREARESDSGKYICLGANTLGYSFRSAFLSVLRRPPHSGSILNWERTVILRPGQPDAVMIGIPITVGVLVGVVVALAILCHSRRGNQRQSQEDDATDKDTTSGSCPALKSVEQQTSFSSFPPPNFQHSKFTVTSTGRFNAVDCTTTTETDSLCGGVASSLCESTTASSYRPHFFHSEVVYQEKSVVSKLHDCSPKDRLDCFFLRDNV